MGEGAVLCGHLSRSRTSTTQVAASIELAGPPSRLPLATSTTERHDGSSLATGARPSEQSHTGMIDIMTPPTAAKDQGGEEVGEEGSLDRSSVQYGMESVESSDEVSPADYHVVEHSPQGRYVRFNAPLGGGTYKEVWKAYDTSEGVEVAWSTLCLQDIPALDKKRIIQEIKTLEKVSRV